MEQYQFTVPQGYAAQQPVPAAYGLGGAPATYVGGAPATYVGGVPATVEYVAAPQMPAMGVQETTIEYVSAPQTVEYVSAPQAVEYVSTPQTVEYVSAPQAVEYVSPPQGVGLTPTYANVDVPVAAAPPVMTTAPVTVPSAYAAPTSMTQVIPEAPPSMTFTGTTQAMGGPPKDPRHMLLGKDVEYKLNQTESRLKKLDSRLAMLEGRKPLLPKPSDKRNEQEKAVTKKLSMKENAAFVKNMSLALRTSFFVVLFGLPTYSDVCATFVFGETRTVLDADGKAVLEEDGVTSKTWCDASMLGRWYNSAADGALPDLVRWNDQESTWTGEGKQIQCGYLPDVYEGYWPTVMMMTVFSVYQNTGQTCRLSWQGCVGTWWAVVNNVVMSAIFPHGALGPHMDPPMPYSEFVSYVDLIVVIVIYLISTSDTNTIKFGLSTHVCLMISFMNPSTGPNQGIIPSPIPKVNWDNEAVCWLLTAWGGAAVAILATLVYPPLLNITQVDDISEAYCERTGRIFDSTIEYLCGHEKTPNGDQIGERILRSSQNLSGMKQSIADAWWECYGMGQISIKLKLYSQYEDALSHLQGVVMSVRRAVVFEDFTGLHTSFFTPALHESMHELKERTKDLMCVTSGTLNDGQIDEQEITQLNELSVKVKDQQKALIHTYISQTQALKDNKTDGPKGGAGISRNLGMEHLLLFCLSTWGRRVAFFVDKGIGDLRDLKKSDMKAHLMAAMQSVKDTWDPTVMFTKEQILYTIRNTLSIVTVFWMSTNLNDGLFVGYSFVMGNTLALLISRTPGTTFLKSIQRLLGVTMGKVLPLLALGVINLTDCGTFINVFWHAFCVMLFMTGFIYMYFTSEKFAVIGCFTAAFGCSFLFTRCVSRDFSATYASRYKELGQIVCAIVVQQVYDFIFEYGQDPRVKAVESMKKIKASFVDGFAKFFEGDKYLRSKYDDITSSLSAAEVWCSEADPSLMVCPGWTTPFDVKLYQDAFDLFNTLKGDFFLLTLATGAARNKDKEEHQNDHISQYLYGFYGKPALKIVEQALMAKVNDTFDSLISLLEHDSGEKIKEGSMHRILYDTHLRELDGVQQLVEEMNQDPQLHEYESKEKSYNDVTEIVNMRLQVALQAIENANNTLADIVELITEHNLSG